MLEKQLKLYGLAKKEVCEIDLRTCYMQQRPNNPLNKVLMEGDKVNSNMMNSPHYELAKRYIRRGQNNARRRFRRTRYYRMMRIFGRKHFPEKFPGLVHSMKKGYLRRKRKKYFIVVLMQPFAYSRYNRDVPMLVPEVWSGHHRIGILLALRKYAVQVMVAEDTQPGTCKCVGKIHDLCVLK